MRSKGAYYSMQSHTETVTVPSHSTTMGIASTLDIVRSKISTARSVTVLTGAGISADSGVPTFRGTDGLWRTFRAEDLATPEAFARDPRLVWEWYNWRRELIATKRPNAAHDVVAQMERRFERFWLITQNVDGLHRDAGSRNLSEIHGNIWMVRCTGAGVWPRIEMCRSPFFPVQELRRTTPSSHRLVWRITRGGRSSEERCRPAGQRPLLHHRHVRPGVSGGRICLDRQTVRRLRRGDQSRSHTSHRTRRCCASGPRKGHCPIVTASVRGEAVSR